MGVETGNKVAAWERRLRMRYENGSGDCMGTRLFTVPVISSSLSEPS